MALELTTAARLASEKVNVNPTLVLQIAGVETLFGAVPIEKYIRIGDPDLEIGNDWVIGGLNGYDASEDLLSLEGTGTKIQQQLMPDKGAVSSAGSIRVTLVDARNTITNLISPGQVVDDIMGRRAKLFMGFRGTAFPEDFVEIFQGAIDEIDSGAGNVAINLVHPDQKKRQKCFIRKDAVLSGGINAAVTNIPVTDADEIFEALPTGPDGSTDAAIRHFVRIDDEIIEYTGLSATNLTGGIRASLGTTAATHASAAKVTSFYVLEEAVMELALKFMLSGWNGGYIEDEEVSSVGDLPVITTSSTTYFVNLPTGKDAEVDYGARVGDYIRLKSDGVVSGTWNQIVALEDLESESNRQIEVTDALNTMLNLTALTIEFRSQYDTLGQGLKMTPLEVDVEEHERWSALILSGYEYRFYLPDTVEGKEFLEKEIYMPYGSYAIPRKGRCSVGYHIGPLASAEIKILDKTNIKNPSKIRLKRSSARNFYNAVTYKFDESPLESGKFETGYVKLDADSLNRIRDVGTIAFSIEAKGIRTDLLALANAEASATRRLNRYKFGAEYFENVGTFFKTGWNIEPGDLVIFDFEDLKVSNTTDGTREKPAKFFEVTNKSLDLKTGDVQLSLTDTNYDASERYGLFSPSSVVGSGCTTTMLLLTESYGGIFGADEWRKWEDFVGLPILVHDSEWTFSEEVTFIGLDAANKNRMLIDPATPLSLAPTAGYIVDLPVYSSSPEQRTNRLYKLIHAHFSPVIDVVTGVDGTSITVDPADIDEFAAGLPARVHSVDFSSDSGEVKVLSVVGVTVTFDADLGFTPSVGMKVSLLGFPDRDSCYRFI